MDRGGRGKEKKKRLDLMDGLDCGGGLVRLKLKHWGLTGAGRENKKEEEETVHSRGVCVCCVCVHAAAFRRRGR